jgi:hypothetical protein
MDIAELASRWKVSYRAGKPYEYYGAGELSLHVSVLKEVSNSRLSQVTICRKSFRGFLYSFRFQSVVYCLICHEISSLLKVAVFWVVTPCSPDNVDSKSL